jgi:hypothetical protein
LRSASEPGYAHGDCLEPIAPDLGDRRAEMIDGGPGSLGKPEEGLRPS